MEKEGNVESWNDERLDELSRRIDTGFKEMREGFDRIGKEMKESFGRVDREMKEGFLEVNRRIDRLMLALLVGTLGLTAVLLAAVLS